MTAGAAEIADAALDPAADATVEALALCFALVASCYIIPALAARCSLTHATSQLLPAHCPHPVVPAPCSPCFLFLLVLTAHFVHPGPCSLFLHTGVRPKLPPRLHFCVVASHHTHTHTHHTLVLGPSYLPSCTFVWLPATTHTHTPHWC